jgi:phage shock protein PspC (stress-responsive transcriptional regulator)
MRRYHYSDRFDDRFDGCFEDCMEERGRPQLQLDPRHSKVGGVCAGLARYLGIQRVFVRIAAVIALLCVTTPTLIAYVVTYLLLDRDR